MIFALLVAAAFFAGAINSVAGGGSFLTFPSLVFAGVPAVMANASSTVALVPAALSSAVSYRNDVQAAGAQNLKSWALICLVGGFLGAVLLLNTSDRTFRQIAPWLLFFATLLFAFGARLSQGLSAHINTNTWIAPLLLFPIAVYGGYFGGGIGIMILATFRLLGMTDIHAMNGIKTLLSGLLNFIAAVVFIFMRDVDWRPTLMMMVAGIIGGYVGPVLARRTSPSVIRAIVIVVGALMTVYFFRIAPR